MLPQTELEVQRANSNFPCYIPPRRADVVEAELPKKAVTTMIAPQIPIGMTLLHDILSELAILKFQDFNTQQEEGLQIKDCMSITQCATSDAQVLKPKKWSKGLATVGLTNMLFMPHFGHSIQVNTYMK